MRYLLFEIDGTLYCKRRYWPYLSQGNEKENDYLSKKIQVSPARVQELISEFKSCKGYTTKTEVVVNEFGLSPSWWNEIRVNCYQTELLECDKELNEFFAWLVTDPGVKIIFATNSPEVIGRGVLASLGLESLIEEYAIPVFGPDSLESYKPKSEYFERIVDIIGGNFVEYTSVGDREPADLIPAAALGMRGLLVNGPGDVMRLLREESVVKEDL